VDPESAAVVLNSWSEVTLVPWETAMQYALTRPQFEELTAISTPRAEFFQRIFAKRFTQQIGEIGVCYDPDPLAMAVALKPGIVRRSERRFVQVELSGQLTRGQSVVDWSNQNGNPPNVTIVMEIDAPRYNELLRLGLQ
jgi:purine nucleosidase